MKNVYQTKEFQNKLNAITGTELNPLQPLKDDGSENWTRIKTLVIDHQPSVQLLLFNRFKNPWGCAETVLLTSNENIYPRWATVRVDCVPVLYVVKKISDDAEGFQQVEYFGLEPTQQFANYESAAEFMREAIWFQEQNYSEITNSLFLLDDDVPGTKVVSASPHGVFPMYAVVGYTQADGAIPRYQYSIRVFDAVETRADFIDDTGAVWTEDLELALELMGLEYCFAHNLYP